MTQVKVKYLNYSGEDLDGINPVPKVLALGFFDGVHLGHQRVINTAKQIAKEKHLPLAVMTFNHHPCEIFKSANDLSMKYLSSLEEKIRLMGNLGVNILYVVNFDLKFANLAQNTFVDKYIVGLNAKHVVAGFDYTFGKFGAGNMGSLSSLSNNRFKVTTVDQLSSRKEKISSTRIRKLIKLGKISQADKLLGHSYQIDGRIYQSVNGLFHFLVDNPKLQLPVGGNYIGRLANDINVEVPVSINEAEQIFLDLPTSIVLNSFSQAVSIDLVRENLAISAVKPTLQSQVI